jgi:hypothetical protein
VVDVMGCGRYYVCACGNKLRKGMRRVFNTYLSYATIPSSVACLMSKSCVAESHACLRVLFAVDVS